MLGAPEPDDNSVFTEVEQAEVSRQIPKIRKSLSENFELSEEQSRRIAERLDEAEEASRRVGRKDWILLFSGAVFSLILIDLITPM
jgi:hypothetical protein